MAISEVDGAVVAREPVVDAVQGQRPTDQRPAPRTGPSRPELARRVVILVFGLIQVVVGARIILLLLDAREGNALVGGILSVSQAFVAPFEGILKTDSLGAAGSVLDLAAILAFIGWTVVELIVIWAIAIFRREPA
jgi:hypothetical protein